MKKKKGYVLVTTIIIFTFLITILAALLTFAVANVNNVNNYNKMNSSFYAAESGTERLKYVAESPVSTGGVDLIKYTFNNDFSGKTLITFDKNYLNAGFGKDLYNALNAAMNKYQNSGPYYDKISYYSGLSASYNVVLDYNNGALLTPTPIPSTPPIVTTSVTCTYQIPIVSTGKYGKKSKVENSFLVLTIKVVMQPGSTNKTVILNRYAWKW